MADDVEPVGAVFAHELHKLGTFGVLVDGQVVRLDELTVGEVATVQRATGVPWVDLLQQPTADLLGALALVQACEAHTGADVSLPDAMTVGELLDRVVRVTPALEVVQPEAL